MLTRFTYLLPSFWKVIGSWEHFRIGLIWMYSILIIYLKMYLIPNRLVVRLGSGTKTIYNDNQLCEMYEDKYYLNNNFLSASSDEMNVS